MKIIINATPTDVMVETKGDPDLPNQPENCQGWTKQEFRDLTGLDVPDNVTQMSLEPDRGIYAIAYDFETPTIYKNPDDEPVIKALIDAKAELRMHGRAKLEQNQSNGLEIVYYDAKKKKLIREDHPEKNNKIGRDFLYTNNSRFVRYHIELIDLLIAKGVIAEADLSEDHKIDTDRVRPYIEMIDWSKHRE